MSRYLVLGGSGGGGSTSTTTQAGVSKDVKPYQQQQLGIDQRLFTGQNYPQQSVAPFSPNQQSAFDLISGLTGQEQNYSSAAQNANNLLATGQNPAIQQSTNALTGIATGQNSALNTAEGSLGSIASGQNTALNTAENVLGGTALGQNPQLQQELSQSNALYNDPSIAAAIAANQNIAQGGNLNADTNKALQSYIQAGLRPMEQAYQNVTEPTILSNAALTGNIGSPQEAQQQKLADSQFAQEIGDYTARVVEPAYETGLGQQETAIQNATGLLAPKEQATQNLGNIAGQQIGAASSLPGAVNTQVGAASALPGAVNTQIGAASAVPGQFNPQLSALGETPALTTNAYTPAQQQLGAGTQQQQQAQNVLNTIFGNQTAPYQYAQQGAGLVGALQGTGGQSFSINSQPGQGTIK